MRPPAIVVCEYDCRSPGNANAHFSLSFGTSAAARPAAPWYRVFDVFCPQPLQAGPLPGANGALRGVQKARAAGVVESAVAKVLPVTNSAMARRSGALRPLAIVTIDPVSIADSTRSGSMARNCSRVGARPTPASWHCAHARW